MSSQVTSKPLKTSVIGMGMSATVFHIPFILSLPEVFVLHSVMERSSSQKKSLAQEKYIDTGKVKSLKIVSTLDEIVKDEEVDVVVICTPNSTHEEYTEAALKHHKHVILEKPSFVDSVTAKKMFELASEQNRLIAVYQNRRFDSDFLTLKKILASKVLGDIKEIETRFDRFKATLPTSWKSSGLPGHGIVYDLGSHLLDQIISLYGTPSFISAPVLRNSRGLGSQGFHDDFISILEYESGVNAIVRGSSLSARNFQERYSVRGTKGSWRKIGVDVQEDQLKGQKPMELTDALFGKEPEEIQGELTLANENGFTFEKTKAEKGNYQLWYTQTGAALQANDVRKLVVSPSEAIDLIRLIEAIYQSSKEGGKKIKI